MVSVYSTAEDSEKPSSPESSVTFLSPLPAPGQLTLAASSESSSSSGEEDMESAEDNDEEEENEDQDQEGEVENGREGEKKEAGEDRPQCYVASAANAVQTRRVFQGLGYYVQAPPLAEAKVEELKQRWLEVHILELEAYKLRLALLQEECEINLEELKERKAGTKNAMVYH